MYLLFGVMWGVSSLALLTGNGNEKPHSSWIAAVVYAVTTVCITVLTIHGFK